MDPVTQAVLAQLREARSDLDDSIRKFATAANVGIETIRLKAGERSGVNSVIEMFEELAERCNPEGANDNEQT